MPPPSISYRSLCISEINRSISDNSLKEEIYKKFEKFGDFFNIKISFFNNQRVAYINFTYDEDARRACQEFHSLHLFGRSVKVEPVPIKTRNRYRDSRSPPSPYFRKRITEESPTSYSSLNHEIRSTAQKPYREEYYDEYSPKEFYYREQPMKPRYVDEFVHEEDYRNHQSFKPIKYKNEWFYPLDATRSLFIGSIPEDITEDDLYKIFKPFGPITDVDIKRATKGKNNTYAFVKFFTLDYALKAREEMQGQLIGKIPCKIGFGKPTPTKKLWIGGLGTWTTLGLLEREFDKFGPILKIDYLKGDSFAFILYDTVDSAEIAYHEMKGIELAAELSPNTRIMTDFSDTKSTFYDGTGVSNFLESYHKPVNYLTTIRRQPPPHKSSGYYADGREMIYETQEYEYKRVPKKHRSPRYEMAEREEGEMAEDGEAHPSMKRKSKKNVSVSPPPKRNRSASSEYYESHERKRTVRDGNKFNSGSHKKRERNGEQNAPPPKNNPNDVYFSGSSSRSKSSSSYQSNSNKSSPHANDNHGKKVKKTHTSSQKPHKNRQEKSNAKTGEKYHRGSSSASSHSKSPSDMSHKASPNKKRPNNVNNNESETLKNNKSLLGKTTLEMETSERERITKCTSLDSLLKMLEPSAWTGDFTIKNSAFPLSLYHVKKGDPIFAKTQVLPSLHKQSELQIVQRFRLDSSKIDDMAKLINKNSIYNSINMAANSIKIDPEDVHCIFLALDRSPKESSTNNDKIDPKSHKRLLKDLIHYLKQKNAAGVVFLDQSPPGLEQSDEHGNDNILYAFPPCEFTKQFFSINFPNILLPGEDGGGSSIQYYLLIVILKGASKKKH
ncbi:unnamed protein product [Gordionus sp. m RMFG-2023]|uniref:RNA-binding protein 15-like n=1 Tax=Gordionus sp. m RMFG-2023 TaxID=3053472 RepID=UPI0030DE5AFA